MVVKMIHLIDNENLINYNFPMVDEEIINSKKYQGAFPNDIIDIHSVEQINLKVNRRKKEILEIRQIEEISTSIMFKPDVFESGDVIIVFSFISISQNLVEVLKTILDLIENGVRLISLYENFDSMEDSSINLINSLPYLLSFEEINNEFNKRKQLAGFKNAKKRGVQIGKKSYSTDDLPMFYKYYEQWKSKHITKTEFALLLNVSRPTLNRLIEKAKNELKLE